LDLFQALCREKAWPYIRLDGSTSASKRQKLVDQFNDMTRKEFVFLLSSRAGGCGLNLIGGNRLILFDPDWNPATDLQAAARVWRDGQRKKVYVYRFLAAGTLEEKVFQRQMSKKGLQTIVVEEGDETVSLSSEDLRNLFCPILETPSDTHDMLRCQRCRKPEIENGMSDDELVTLRAGRSEELAQMEEKLRQERKNRSLLTEKDDTVTPPLEDEKINSESDKEDASKSVMKKEDSCPSSQGALSAVQNNVDIEGNMMKRPRTEKLKETIVDPVPNRNDEEEVLQNVVQTSPKSDIIVTLEDDDHTTNNLLTIPEETTSKRNSARNQPRSRKSKNKLVPPVDLSTLDPDEAAAWMIQMADSEEDDDTYKKKRKSFRKSRPEKEIEEELPLAISAPTERVTEKNDDNDINATDDTTDKKKNSTKRFREPSAKVLRRARIAEEAERKALEADLRAAVAESLAAPLPPVEKGVVRRQLKWPAEDDLSAWSHHEGVTEVADDILVEAGQDGLVSFVFGLEVRGRDLAELAKEAAEKAAAAKIAAKAAALSTLQATRRSGAADAASSLQKALARAAGSNAATVNSAPTTFVRPISSVSTSSATTGVRNPSAGFRRPTSFVAPTRQLTAGTSSHTGSQRNISNTKRNTASKKPSSTRHKRNDSDEDEGSFDSDEDESEGTFSGEEDEDENVEDPESENETQDEKDEEYD
jgi:Helicase conserved C-terminal domain